MISSSIICWWVTTYIKYNKNVCWCVLVNKVNMYGVAGKELISQDKKIGFYLICQDSWICIDEKWVPDSCVREHKLRESTSSLEAEHSESEGSNHLTTLQHYTFMRLKNPAVWVLFLHSRMANGSERWLPGKLILSDHCIEISSFFPPFMVFIHRIRLTLSKQCSSVLIRSYFMLLKINGTVKAFRVSTHIFLYPGTNMAVVFVKSSAGKI